MNLASKRGIQNLLKKYRVRPSKRLGQNFLINKRVIKKLIRTANLKPEDIVLEIGPGIGTLTIELAKKIKKVIAIEKDQKMVEILKETLKNFKNVKIIKGDILKFRIFDFGFPSQDSFPSSYKLVGNLPFYLTTPVIRKFLEAIEVKPCQMILVVQKEVGKRICAKPPRMNILAVSVQFYAKPEIISYISKKSFWPSPTVDSVIIKISAFNRRRKSAFNQRFFQIVKVGFSHPRKQLINNLSKGLKIERNEVKRWLLKNNIRPSQRAETLSVGDWINLLQSCRIN
jgi:16S rRNA (adenine1518-N6/adenine1519-N6)-dimethyltransferase